MSGYKTVATIISIVIFAGVVAVLFFNSQLGQNSTIIAPSGTSTTSVIAYTANGKIDTSDWQEYRSEFGGFSVRAPKDMSAIGCFGHACDPSIWGEQFYYLLIKGSDEDIGLSGLNIQIIKKPVGSELDTWLDEYVVSGKNKLLNVQKISVGDYPALQFDRQKEVSEASENMVMVKTAAYPSGNVYEFGLALSTHSAFRYLVVDLGNRYSLIHYTLPTNWGLFSGYLTTRGYSRIQVSQIPNDKTLADIYAAILDSFQAFTPTKP